MGGYRLDVSQSAWAAESDGRTADAADRRSVQSAKDDAGNEQPICSGEK